VLSCNTYKRLTAKIDETKKNIFRPNDIWTYVSYGPDCGIEVNRAVEVDHGLWEGFVTLSDSKKFFVYIRGNIWSLQNGSLS